MSSLTRTGSSNPVSLTIVIVNWNGGEMLRRCLQSIRASTVTFPVKVIVVDNDSTDGSREAARREFPEYRVFNSGGNLGFGRGNNLARQFADTSFVLFLNPDTELKPDTLELSIKCLQEHADVGALGCKMLCPDGKTQQQGIQWHLTPWRVFVESVLVTRGGHGRLSRWLPTLDPDRSSYVTKIYGGYILARREVLDRAGWFDDRYFMYAEDADLSRTIQALGWKLYYTAEAEIIHAGGGTSNKAPSGFSILMMHQSIGGMMRKYYGLPGALGYRLAVCAGAAVRLTALGVLAAFSVLRRGDKTGRLSAAFFKQRLTLLWAFGLRKPTIARSGAHNLSVNTDSDTLEKGRDAGQEHVSSAAPQGALRN